MAFADPIRTKKHLREIANYWLHLGNLRNYVLIILGVYTALRISDLLKLTWDDVYDATSEKYRSHISLTETKTGKHKKIALNSQAIVALQRYFLHKGDSDFIFASNRKDGRAISRFQAWRIIKTAANAASKNTKTTTTTKTSTTKTTNTGATKTNITKSNTTKISATISPHSLRKTFGYFAWLGGISPVMIMDIYNHSSYEVTKRYLGITQDDRDKIYLEVLLL